MVDWSVIIIKLETAPVRDDVQLHNNDLTVYQLASYLFIARQPISSQIMINNSAYMYCLAFSVTVRRPVPVPFPVL